MIRMKKTLIVEGMSCGHCEKAVINSLREFDEVSDVKVNLQTKEVEVEGDNLNDGRLKEKIDDAGYEVVKID
jgi:copper chaperone